MLIVQKANVQSILAILMLWMTAIETRLEALSPRRFQRKSFSLHKRRSLLKPMLIVSTTGYIIACIGPFLSNYSNNDASIMQNILHHNTDDIRNWLNEVYQSSFDKK